MEKKIIYKLINEELNNFSFLGIDKKDKKDEIIYSKEFQTKLIFDIINNLSNKEIFPYTSFIYNTEEDSNTVSFEDTHNLDVELSVKYNYDDITVELTILLFGHNIIDINQTDDIEFKIFDEDGGKLDLSWLTKNKDLRNKFIKKIINQVS